MSLRFQNKNGFTFIELLVVVAFLALASSAVFFILKNQSFGNLESDGQIIAARLLEAQTRAIAGVNGSSWGIHFNNVTSSAPWYALFQGATFTEGAETYYLSGSVEFQSPAASTSTDLIFTRLTGRISTSTSIIVRLKTNTSEKKTITVTTEGKISLQ